MLFREVGLERREVKGKRGGRCLWGGGGGVNLIQWLQRVVREGCKRRGKRGGKVYVCVVCGGGGGGGGGGG